jgi:hypothetical protein
MPSFETAIPANERPQTYALDRTANAIGGEKSYSTLIHGLFSSHLL